MLRPRIAVGIASSLVAVSALTMVLAGTGEAQGTSSGPQVTIANTPLPVTGNVNAAVTGNVNAAVSGNVSATVTGQVTVNNSSDSPVLIRDVDRDGVKELWQENKVIFIPDGEPSAEVEFDTVPDGKALIIEHINIFFQNPSNLLQGVRGFALLNRTSSGFGSGSQFFMPQQVGIGFIADAETKFYVWPGNHLAVWMVRAEQLGQATLAATATGYVVDYP